MFWVSYRKEENDGELSAEAVGRLVQRARRGDLSAFDKLVRQFQRRVNAVVYRLLNNVDDSLEITQDAFVKAYDKLSTLSSVNQFGPWLMRIASNLALNRRRSRALRSAATIDAPDCDGRPLSLPDRSAFSPLDSACASEFDEALSEAMSELPEIQRQALTMFSIGKIPQKDVAKELGCSVEAVKWHVFSARKKLKDVLVDYL